VNYIDCGQITYLNNIIMKLFKYSIIVLITLYILYSLYYVTICNDESNVFIPGVMIGVMILFVVCFSLFFLGVCLLSIALQLFIAWLFNIEHPLL